MHLTSINVGVAVRLGDLVTGICKESQRGPVQLTPLGLQGDAVCDKKYHGGEDQAVYVYGGDDYAHWASDHGLNLQPGMFGDNLTISDLSSLNVSVGDRFAIDEVVLEATAPRIPCATLGRRMADPKFPALFRRSQRTGFYCRVIEQGALSAGSDVSYIAVADPNPFSICEMFELYYDANASRAQFLRALEAPIASRDRERFDERLKALDD